MPSGAVRLPGAAALTAAAGRCRHRRQSRHGWPSAADAATRAGLGQPSRRWPWPSRMSGRRTRHWSPVRVRCPPGGRLSTGSGGRPVSNATGVQRDRRDPGVRTDTPPVTVAPASALSAPRWILACVGAAGPPTSGRVGCDMSRWSASGWSSLPELGPGGEGMVVGSAVPGSDRVDGRPAAGMDPRRLRRRARRRADMGAGPAQGAGRLAGGTSRSSCSHVAVRVRPGPVAGVMAGWAGRC
jgi:hypothetical protein